MVIVSQKSNFGNSYCTKLILGPGNNENLCQKMRFSQICPLPLELYDSDHHNNYHYFQCGLGPSRHRRCCQGHQCPLHHYSLQDYWYSGRIKWKSTNAEICMRGNAEVCIRGNKRAALRVISFSHQLNGCSPSI